MSIKTISIKITAKNVEQFQRIESCVKAIGNVELVNKFDRVEEGFDLIMFYPNDYTNFPTLDLPSTCKIQSVEFSSNSVRERNEDKTYYFVKVYVKVTPAEEGVRPFTAIFHIRNLTPQIEIINRY